MATISTDIYLDVAEKSSLVCLYAKQGDAGSRQIKVHLTDHGTAYTPSGAVTARYRVLKSDGHSATGSASHSGGVVTFTLSGDALDCEGNALVDVVIEQNSTALSTVSFILSIEKAPVGNPDSSYNSYASLKQMQYVASQLLDKMGQGSSGQVWTMTTNGPAWANSGANPQGTRNITANGDYDVISYANAHVAVPEPSGTKSITSNGTHDVKNYASANVAVPEPSGTINISSNGTHNVKNYASANVNVSGGITPTGTININQNGTHNVTNYASANVNVPGPSGTKNITANGTYDVADYASAYVDVAASGGDVVVSDSMGVTIANQTAQTLDVSITIPEDGDYKFKYGAGRSSTSGTWTLNVRKSGTSTTISGSNVTWSTRVGSAEFTVTGCEAGDVYTMYGRSGGTSSYLFVGPLVAIKQGSSPVPTTPSIIVSSRLLAKVTNRGLIYSGMTITLPESGDYNIRYACQATARMSEPVFQAEMQKSDGTVIEDGSTSFGDTSSETVVSFTYSASSRDVLRLYIDSGSYSVYVGPIIATKV